MSIWGSRGASNRGLGGTQELLSVIPLRPTATLDYAEAVPARAEPNAQPRCAVTIPQISANYGPGESRHWWGAGGYSGVSNSRGQLQIHPSTPQDAWAVVQRSRGPRAARRSAPSTDAYPNAASTTVCQAHHSPELPAQIAPAVRPGPLHAAQPSPAALGTLSASHSHRR